MMQVIFALIRKELIQAFRDARMLIILIIAPIVQLVIFGYVATTDIKNVPVVIIDYNQTSMSRALTSSFFTSNHFVRVIPSPDWRGEPEDVLKSGTAKIVVLIPPEFSTTIEKNETAEVMVIVDGSDANLATITNNYVIELVQTFAQNITQEQLNAVGSSQMQILQSIPVVVPHVRIWYNPDHPRTRTRYARTGARFASEEMGVHPG
jgi:ABC-2 type transport system permease protein